MKSILKAFSAVALSGAMVLPALAQTATTTTPTPKDQKDLKKVIEDQGINYVETAQKGITLSGYVDTSYTMQFAGAGQPFGQGAAGPASGSGVANTTANLHQFDTNANGFNLNAVKLALEKALPNKNEWAAGFRVDVMAGADAKSLGASDPTLGDGTSGFYVEQALVKFRIPVGNGLDIYAGKFVTFLGYEVIESPANLNFSRGLLFTNAIPLTNTGVYADYKFNDTVEAKLGIVDGWNNSSSVQSSNPNASYAFGGKAITGQVTVNAPGKNANITTSFIYSPDSAEPQGGSAGSANSTTVVGDIWGNWNPLFVKDSALLLGFNGDFGYNGAAGFPGAGEASTTWYGIALYAQYKFTKVFSLGGRLEWLGESAAAPNDPFGQKFAGTGGSTNDYSATLTATFNIWDNLLTRAEYRHDFLEGVGIPSNQNEISLEAVYSF